MRNRDVIEFLGLWESLHNPDFKPLEFEGFRNQAGANAFTMSPKNGLMLHRQSVLFQNPVVMEEHLLIRTLLLNLLHGFHRSLSCISLRITDG